MGKPKQANPIYVVYFLQSGNRKYVKIGHSCNLRSRMACIAGDVRYGWKWEKVEYAPPYTILGFVLGDYLVERDIQERFDKYRVLKKGYMGFREWFHLKQELVDFIALETMRFVGFDSHGQPLGIPMIQLPLFPPDTLLTPPATNEEQSA